MTDSPDEPTPETITEPAPPLTLAPTTEATQEYDPFEGDSDKDTSPASQTTTQDDELEAEPETVQGEDFSA